LYSTEPKGYGQTEQVDGEQREGHGWASSQGEEPPSPADDHLRSFLGDRPTWRIINRAHLELSQNVLLGRMASAERFLRPCRHHPAWIRLDPHKNRLVREPAYQDEYRKSQEKLQPLFGRRIHTHLNRPLAWCAPGLTAPVGVNTV
jgi:hypothetical protein